MMDRSIALLGAVLLLSSACNKEPGEGGRAEIRGNVYEQRYFGTGNPDGDPQPLPDHRVYIIYGDGDFYDDDLRTGPNGLFVFRWLRKGDYRIYVVSECQGSGCTKILSRDVTISDKKEVVNVGSFTVENW